MDFDLIKADTNIIPEDASINEATYFVLESIQEDFNNLMKDFALNELGIFESTGCEIIYEGSTLAETKAKIKGFVEKSWAKDKGQFENFLQYCNDKTNTIKDNVNGNKIKNSVLSSEVTKNRKGCYSYTGLEEYKAGKGKIAEGVQFLKASTGKVDASNFEDMKKQFANIIGASSPSISNVKKAAIANFKGEKKDLSAEQIKANLPAMWDIVWDFKKAASEVKQAYSSSNSTFKNLSKASDLEDDSTINTVRMKFYNYVAQAIAAIDGAFLTIYKEQLTCIRSIVWAQTIPVLKAYRSKAIKEAVENAKIQESVDRATTDVNDDISIVSEQNEKFESLFDWDLD